MTEAEFIAQLRPLATDTAARGLADDAAVLDLGETRLVLTQDTLVEGIHFLPEDPPGEVAWKLVAVNLSDLAAKGASPRGALLSYPLSDDAWDGAFLAGLATVLRAFHLPLLGGDTVSQPVGSPRVLGLTALGLATGPVPSRSGARPDHQLWVTGTLGDASAGLGLLRLGQTAPADLIERYRSPRPRLEAGQLLAPLVSAMLDVSDGLLLDAARLSAASGCRVTIALDQMPLSPMLLEHAGDSLATRLTAATGGDDYELLFSAPPGQAGAILALADQTGLPCSRIGECAPGNGLALTHADAIVPLPAQLGYLHARG